MVKQAGRFPPGFEKFFWDCNMDTLDTGTHKKFISERILMYGDIPALKWLKARYGVDFIKHVALNSRRLDDRTRNFWKTYFHDTAET